MHLALCLSITIQNVSAQVNFAEIDTLRSQTCQTLYLEELLCWSDVSRVSNNRLEDDACNLSWVLVEECLD